MLFLAGGYEFSQPSPAKPPTPKRLRFLSRAFELLRHDLLFVTPEERALLSKAGAAPQAAWVGSDRLEQHFLPVDGGRIAVLVLPPLPANAPAVPKSHIHQLENAVRGLRGSARLIVAMSPWGYQREQEIYASQGPYPDLLLGSGPGIGQVGLITAEGRSAWIRSFSQGKSILRIDVLAWPEHNGNFKWTEDRNIRMGIYGLTDQYQESPQLLNLMHSMGTD